MPTSRTTGFWYRRVCISVGLALMVAAEHASATDVKLRIMETTDLHMHAMNFDYYRNKEVDDFGMARTATLIRDARAQARNSLLFVKSALFQVDPIGAYMARPQGLGFGNIIPTTGSSTLCV